MDKPIRLSVILPVYNKFECIEYCIKSLLNQGVNDVAEAIFVDDGSTDDTLSILKRYQESHPTFIKVISKKNGGVSSARNAGIESAKGEWLLFVDPDDFLAPNTLSFILEKYDSEDTDIIKFGFNPTEGYELWDEVITLKGDILFYGSTKDYVLNYDMTTSCAHLIRRNILADLRYDEDLAYWEDLFLMYRLFLRDENTKILRTSFLGYYYVNNPASVTNLWTSTVCLRKIKCTLVLMEKMLKLKEECVWDSNVSEVIAKKNAFLISVLLANLIRLDSISNREIGEFRGRYNNLRRRISYSKNMRTTLFSSLMLLPPFIIRCILSICRFVFA